MVRREESLVQNPKAKQFLLVDECLVIETINSCFWFPQLVVGDIPLLYQVYIANWVIICYLPPITGTRKLH